MTKEEALEKAAKESAKEAEEARKKKEEKERKEKLAQELTEEERELAEMKAAMERKQREIKRKRATLDNNDSADEFQEEMEHDGKRAAQEPQQPAAKRKKAPAKEVCKHCSQDLDLACRRFYAGHPDDAVEESIALCDPAVMDEDAVMDDDEKPQHRLTDFVFFDEEGHIVRFDSGIVDNGGQLYVTGYMKLIYDDSPVRENGVAVYKAGPILEWWMAGLDGSERHVAGITTEMGW